MNFETGVVGVLCTFLGGAIGKLMDYLLSKRKQDISDQDFLFSKYRQIIDDLQGRLTVIETRTVALQEAYSKSREENIQVSSDNKALRREVDRLTTELNLLKKRMAEA